MQWFYAIDGEKHGPVSPAELARLIARGTVDNETLVWHEGFTAWEPWGLVGGANPLPVEHAPPPLPTTDGLTEAVRSATGAEREWSVDEFSRRLKQQGMATSMGGCLRRAWKNYKANFGLALGAIWVAIIIPAVVLGVLPEMVAEVLPEMDVIAWGVSVIWLTSWFLLIPNFTAGCQWMFLIRARGEQAKFRVIFEGFKRCCGKLFVAGLVREGTSALLMVLMVVFMTFHRFSESVLVATTLRMSWNLVFLAALYLRFRFIFVYIIALDRPLRPMGAFALSWHITRRHQGTLLGLIFILCLLGIAGGLALLIGFIFVVPIYFAVLAQYYHDACESAAGRHPE